MTWDEWLYFSAQVGLAALALAVAWLSAQHVRTIARNAYPRYLDLAVTALLISAGLLSLYEGIDNVLLHPVLPILPSSWVRYFIFDLPLPLVAVLLIRFRRQRDELLNRVQEQSVTDALTGLLNRRGFIEQAAASIAQTRRADTHASVAILDLDHFKSVNDTYGHAAGDALLQAVAVAARRELRAGDLFGRLGGDEFGLLIVGTAAAGAVEVAGRLRLEITAAIGSMQGGDKVGVSAGIAPVEKLGEAMPALDHALSVADAALYEAKRSGRGRLMVASTAEKLAEQTEATPHSGTLAVCAVPQSIETTTPINVGDHPT